MIKQCTMLAAALALLNQQVQAENLNASADLEAKVVNTWTMETNPVDFVQSLDNKKVFILGADSKVHIYTAEGLKLGDFTVDKDVTAIDIAPRGELIYLISNQGKTYSAVDWSLTRQIDTTGNPVKGEAAAPVTMIVFSDFECPYCGQIEPLLNQIYATNQDKMNVVFKHFPLRIHPAAEPAALATIAAQNQGKFWELHDLLFKTKPLNPESIEQAAASLGLDMEQFKKDMASPQSRQLMQKDMLDAQNADVTGTPTLFINGRQVKDRSPAGLQRLIDEEFAKSKKD